jgi:hypothetical protein
MGPEKLEDCNLYSPFRRKARSVQMLAELVSAGNPFGTEEAELCPKAKTRGGSIWKCVQVVAEHPGMQ